MTHNPPNRWRGSSKESMVEPRNNSRCSRRTILWAQQLFVVCLSSATVREVKCTTNFWLFDLDDTLARTEKLTLLNDDRLSEANIKTYIEKRGTPEQAERRELGEWIYAAEEHQKVWEELLSKESKELQVFVLTKGDVLKSDRSDGRLRYISDTFGVKEADLMEFEDLNIDLHGERAEEAWTDPCNDYPIAGIKIKAGLETLFGSSVNTRNIYIVSPSNVYSLLKDGRKMNKGLMKLRLLEIGLHQILLDDSQSQNIRLITVGNRFKDLVLQNVEKDLSWPQCYAENEIVVEQIDSSEGKLWEEMEKYKCEALARFKLYNMRRNLIVEGILVGKEHTLALQVQERNEEDEQVNSDMGHLTDAENGEDYDDTEVFWKDVASVASMTRDLTKCLKKVEGQLEQEKVLYSEKSKVFPRRVGI
eukprot:GHVS01034623.1.p1 GENE.GHVS01034623.1~~GHVS01034623.1.p1  ORF type:complete len:419 (+),score=34.16 GHVS01034623.1:132-1388(+)